MDQLFVVGLQAAELVVPMKDGLKSSSSVYTKLWDVR